MGKRTIRNLWTINRKSKEPFLAAFCQKVIQLITFLLSVNLINGASVFKDGDVEVKSVGLGRHDRKLDISHDPCLINDEPGTCMFNSECFKRKGIVLGACRDGFLFGACCAINPNASSVVIDHINMDDDKEEQDDQA